MVEKKEPKVKVVTVQSQVKIIQIVASLEILVASLILLCQTIAISASYEFSTRSLTGLWTSWFFFMAAGLALFWSVRCTFNGLLAVLVLQIIAATMSIPLFTAGCIFLGVYKFVWNPDEDGPALVGTSIIVFSMNVALVGLSIVIGSLNAYNAYKCYFIGYGSQPESNYDQRSISSSENGEEVEDETRGKTERISDELRQETKSSDLSPSSDLTLSSTDVLIMKGCGAAGVLLAVIIFCSQTAMLALANNVGIKIGIGIWGSLYYSVTGIVTVYSGWKPTSHSAIILFAMHLIQFVISVPLVCISYYLVAAFGSCMQHQPFPDCSYKETIGFGGADLAVTIMAGVMALSGMTQGLLSLFLILICAQAVCGFRCMVSGATVYPKL